MKVIGYVLINNVYDRKYYFEGTSKNLAKFIFHYGKKADRIIITDRLDIFVLSTIGYFIDEIADKKLLDELLNELSPYQYGNKFVPLKFTETEPGVMKL